MSVDAAEKTLDTLVLTVDPFAVRRTQAKARGHHVDVVVDDATGTARVEGTASATDAKAFDERLDRAGRHASADRESRRLPRAGSRRGHVRRSRTVIARRWPAESFSPSNHFSHFQSADLFPPSSIQARAAL
jgi:hypothetical protein